MEIIKKDKVVYSQSGKNQSNDVMLNKKKHRNNYDNKKKSKVEEEDIHVDNPLFQSKSDSITKKLKNQIEFYFSDTNLINDKFLYNYLEKNEGGVEVSMLANFNKIKKLLAHEENYSKKLDIIKTAVLKSNILKLSNDKINRKIKFDKNKVVDNIDKRTIYVENLPNNIDHKAIGEIFKSVGNVLHVSLPKFSDNIGGMRKGFGFIVFEKEDEANLAIEKVNNTIPAELMKGTKEKKPLKILSKMEWQKLKVEFKQLANQLNNQNNGDLLNQIIAHSINEQSGGKLFSSTTETGAVNNNGAELSKGLLVKISDLPESIEKKEIKEVVNHYFTPQYVDLNKEKRECIIRFLYKIYADSFVEKFASTNKPFKLRNKEVKISKLTDKEEDDYLKKVERLKAEFKERRHNDK